MQVLILDLIERYRTVILRNLSIFFRKDELDKNVVWANFVQTTQHFAIKGKSIFKEEELNENATCNDFLQVRNSM